MIQSFRDFEVYKRAFERSKSIPLNVAEGYGKKENPNEFKRFLHMAIGSCNEMRVLLEMAERLGFIERSIFEKYEQEYSEIGKMLTMLRQRWH